MATSSVHSIFAVSVRVSLPPRLESSVPLGIRMLCPETRAISHGPVSNTAAVGAVQPIGGFLFRVLFLVVHGTTQQAMQVFVVQLDNVERGGDAAIRLGNDKHRGSRHLLRLDFGGFGFLPPMSNEFFSM
mgnify:CR=1 FL=1